MDMQTDHDFDALMEQAREAGAGLWGLPDWRRELFDMHFIASDLALRNLFNNPTSSYKSLWVLSIVQMVEGEESLRDPDNIWGVSRDDDANITLRQDEIFIRMIANAWYPACVGKLNFGKNIGGRSDDAAQTWAENLSEGFPELDGGALEGTSNLPDIATLITKFRTLDAFDKLTKEMRGSIGTYVPTAFLNSFPESRKPYIINKVTGHPDQTTIALSDDFANFIKSYPEVIKTYILDKFAAFLMKRNPLAVNVRNILEPQSLQRGNLVGYRNLWAEFTVHENYPLLDYIDGERLEVEGNTPIDHCIPFSYIGIDSAWNLMPVSTENNSSKSNRIITFTATGEIGDTQKRFLEQQYQFHNFLHIHHNNSDAYSEYYDIKIPDLASETAFKNLLTETLESYSKRALRQGFAKFDLLYIYRS
jgi:hypothetical protein